MVLYRAEDTFGLPLEMTPATTRLFVVALIVTTIVIAASLSTAIGDGTSHMQLMQSFAVV